MRNISFTSSNIATHKKFFHFAAEKKNTNYSVIVQQIFLGYSTTKVTNFID